MIPCLRLDMLEAKLPDWPSIACQHVSACILMANTMQPYSFIRHPDPTWQPELRPAYGIPCLICNRPTAEQPSAFQMPQAIQLLSFLVLWRSVYSVGLHEIALLSPPPLLGGRGG